MSNDNAALPDGWTEADMHVYLSRHDQSGTYNSGEEVATTDVPEISEEGSVA